MKYATEIFFLLIASLLPYSAYAENCQEGLYACVTYDKDPASGRVSILLKNKVQGERLQCFLATNAGRPVFFEIESSKGPFHHPLVYSSTQYSWRCDLESSKPRWFPKNRVRK